jgi:hypothetical protein
MFNVSHVTIIRLVERNAPRLALPQRATTRKVVRFSLNVRRLLGAAIAAKLCHRYQAIGRLRVFVLLLRPHGSAPWSLEEV